MLNVYYMLRDKKELGRSRDIIVKCYELIKGVPKRFGDNRTNVFIFIAGQNFGVSSSCYRGK